MQTEYVTERRTVVTANRIGRPRKQPGDPKSPYTPRKRVIPPGMFEIVEGDDPASEMVLVDGLLPRKLANLIRELL